MHVHHILYNLTIKDVEWLKEGKQARNHSTKQFGTQTLYGHLFLHYVQGDFMLNCSCYDPYLVPYFLPFLLSLASSYTFLMSSTTEQQK